MASILPATSRLLLILLAICRPMPPSGSHGGSASRKIVRAYGVRHNVSTRKYCCLTRSETGRPVGLVSWAVAGREVHAAGANGGLILPHSLIAAGPAALRRRQLLIAQHPMDALRWASALAAAGEREAVVVGALGERDTTTLAALIMRHVPNEVAVLPIGMFSADNLSVAA